MFTNVEFSMFNWMYVLHDFSYGLGPGIISRSMTNCSTGRKVTSRSMPGWLSWRTWSFSGPRRIASMGGGLL